MVRHEVAVAGRLHDRCVGRLLAQDDGNQALVMEFVHVEAWRIEQGIAWLPLDYSE